MELMNDTMKSTKTNTIKKDGRAFKDDTDKSRDHHLDFDMFDYCYALCTKVDSYSAILSPLGHPIKGLSKMDSPQDWEKFGDGMFTSMQECEDYLVTHPKVACDDIGVLKLRSDRKEDFDDIIAVCDLYKIVHTDPVEYSGGYHLFKWSMTITVPSISKGYPMLLEDYFESINVPLEEVMPASWVKSYRNKIDKLNKSAKTAHDELVFERIYKEAVTYAWQRGDISIDDHLKALIEKLNAAGIEYKSTLTKKRFKAEFEDEDYIEEVTAPVDLFAEVQPA